MGTVTDQRIGAVVIGRNEGKRLRRCLDSVVRDVRSIVYVDSGSADDSVAIARSLGIDVVELDQSVPFSAARARNVGFTRVTELEPATEFVHFFDGDCEVVDGWVTRALEAIAADPSLAVVWGRRRERYPEKTVYNRLCDVGWKWNWLYGEVDTCGGDALMRGAALLEIGGFNPVLVAGEERELCYRLRQQGWRIFRIDADMTLHDADMTRLSQFWRREIRGGYADAEMVWRYRHSKNQPWRRATRSTWFWGLMLPIVTLASAWWGGSWSLVLLTSYPLLGLRIYVRTRRKGACRREALLYAFSCLLEKFPRVAGPVRFGFSRCTRRRSVLIEYK